MTASVSAPTTRLPLRQEAEPPSSRLASHPPMVRRRRGSSIPPLEQTRCSPSPAPSTPLPSPHHPSASYTLSPAPGLFLLKPPSTAPPAPPSAPLPASNHPSHASPRAPPSAPLPASQFPPSFSRFAPGSPIGAATRFPSSVSFVHVAPEPVNTEDDPGFLPFIAATPLLHERAWPPRATSSSAPGSQRNHFRPDAAPFVLTQATAEESAPMASLRAEPAPFAFPPAIAQWSAPMASHYIQLPDQAIGKGGVPLGSQHKQLPSDAPAFAPREMKPKFGLKTVICKCRSADGCRFAHGEEELLKVDPRGHGIYPANQTIGGAELRARRYKTAMCKRWQADDPMACPDGVNCFFAHGPQELRDADHLPAVCCFYLAGKACPLDGCPFRHCI